MGAYGRISGSAGNNGTVLVQGDGTIDASSQLKMPSYMLLNICGTVDVTGSATGSDRSPFYARDRTDIQIPHLTLTGNAQYGMFFRDVSNLHLGDIYINGTGGLGIRIGPRRFELQRPRSPRSRPAMFLRAANGDAADPRAQHVRVT